MNKLVMHERRFYCRDTEEGIFNFRQNMEAPNADHWQIELTLERWRTKKELAAYLRQAADAVERLPKPTE